MRASCSHGSVRGGSDLPLIAFFAWLAAVLALGADRPLPGILLGFIPGLLLAHVASWFLPMVLRGQAGR